MTILTGIVLIAVMNVRSETDTRVAGQRSNTHALCSLRADVQKRVTDGQAFLKTHPEGIPGIPAPTLQSSITNSQRTVKALSSLICPKSPPKRH